MSLLRDELLNPIPGENPGGSDLRYDPIFDKIKEARREDDDTPQGDWQTARKTADWLLVIKLSKDVLATKAKDVQIAAWLTEAMLRREGFTGLRAGLDLLQGMLDQFWEHLYPAIEDGDAEMRAAPLEWVGLKLDVPVRFIGIDAAGHDIFKYRESRTVPTEADAVADYSKRPIRDAAVAAQKLLPEDFDRSFDATPKAWYKALVAEIAATLETLQALDELAQEKFGDVSPNFAKLRDAIEEVQHTVQLLLKKKLELDPDPIEETASEEVFTESGGDAGPATGRALTAEPTSRDDAAARIVGAARWLRQNDAFSPAPYLLLRGFRWGELRAGGGSIDPKLLEAPTTQTRTHLKRLLLDSNWSELLEASESTLGTPQGRGWLDLQRYALTACEQLGAEYRFASDAIRTELRALLTDLPTLHEMTMMDDTPTANTETREWLRDSVLAGMALPGASNIRDESSDGDSDPPRARGPRASVQAEVRSGRTDQAIAILVRDGSREKSKRGRFLYQTELANILVDSGHVSVAMPILQELLTSIETHRLEEWESGELVAQPMILMHRALTQTGADSGTQQTLYLRICRLDPVRAVAMAKQPTQ